MSGTFEDRLLNDFAEIFIEHSPRIFRRSHLWLGSYTEAEDATNETFFRALRAIHGGKGPEVEASLRGWLNSICYNCCVDIIRKRQLLVVLPPNQESGYDPASQIEQDLIVEGAISRLPPRLQEPIRLCYFQGLDHKEGAAVLSVSVIAYKRMLQVAKQELRSSLWCFA